MAKIKVRLKENSPYSEYGYYRKGDIGYLDGYTNGLAVIILENGEFAKANLDWINIVDEDDSSNTGKDVQKSADWSIEDDRIKHHIANAITILDAANYLESNGIEIIDAHVWLEHLKERCLPQPKKDWSDDERKVLDEIINDYEKANKSFSGYQARIDWLKSLRPQKQKEWNKGDIEMIDWLIRCCEEEHKELCNDRYGHQEIVSDLKRDCRKKWDWLESLKNKVAPQNQWKPSESDILLLERIANNKSNPQDFQASLHSLIGQLKKLREE